ncbi:2-amino-4-hydroxy-6-hydroxymethyldihydropteridine diphosphokinase [Maize bushy stunt phytoplasma]|uniref:2-amino-4-hydroxy-6-hydroxymethyldihydropteridine diphosphokinase n=1 Tax=Maize bushy stunt phytoplasma TaxID=202462 RepID=A0ABM6DLT2_9MOLU|nr:2-amino-4-hydroxy-6-hydroxymethyldihydropteridine diphosphokinase [Maize bushy stunt phytoplasma]AOF54713.1 2-amino-4-hydroxy-6-hydroxymethyldihydropteridine diphosphokinase [Maize bushy stunt phytoplasma]
MKLNNNVAAIGLGSNLGAKKNNLQTALKMINLHPQCEVLKVSPLYETLPWGKTDQPLFLNAVALIKTFLPPLLFLDFLLSVEMKLKRKRLELWGLRTIDLDILFLGNHTCKTPKLTIPHPYMLERIFVLAPLADILPNQIIQTKTILEWKNQLDQNAVKIIENNQWYQPSF